MWTLIAIPGFCWLCALLALPRRPLPGNEVEELVYARLLGRHQRVALLALVVTLASFLAFIAALPQQVQRSLSADASSRQICTDAPSARPTCYTRQGDGTWLVEVMGSSGGWMTGMTMAQPPTPMEAASGSDG